VDPRGPGRTVLVHSPGEVLLATLLPVVGFTVAFLGLVLDDVCDLTSSYNALACPGPPYSVEGPVLVLLGVALFAAGVYGYWRAGASRKRLGSVFATTAAVALLIVGLTLVPVPRQFDMHGAWVPDLASTCTGIDTLAGTLISFHWSDPVNVTFGVWSCRTNYIGFEAYGTSGTGSIVSEGGVYEFGPSCGTGLNAFCRPANVTGNYTSPWLAL